MAETQPDTAANLDRAAYLQYLLQRLGQVEVPGVQLDRDRLQQAADQFAAQMGLSRDQFEQITKPMLGLQTRAQDLAESSQRYVEGLGTRQQDINESLGRGQLALQGMQQAGNEALGRESLAQSGYNLADQAELARRQQSAANFGQAETAGLARQGLGVQAANEAEQNTIARERLGAADIASTMNNQGLQALQLLAATRGPRNAFQQQAAMWGLNSAGLNKGVEALAGMPGVTAFKAASMRPEAVSFDTMTQDMRRAGGQRNQITPWDIQMATAQRNAFSPIGVGSQSLLTVADRNIGQQYSPYALATGEMGFQNASENFGSSGQDALWGQAQRNNTTASTYASPSMGGAMDVASVNAPEAAPVGPSDIVRGSGQAFANWVKEWRNASGGQNPPEDKMREMAVHQFGMDPAQADELLQKGRDWFLSGMGEIPAGRIELEAQRILQNGQRGSVNTAQGLGQRAANNYGNVLRRDDLGSLGVNDPRLRQILQTSYGVDATTAHQLAEQNANYYKANNAPMPNAQAGYNAVAGGGGGASAMTPYAPGYTSGYGRGGATADPWASFRPGRRGAQQGWGPEIQRTSGAGTDDQDAAA